MSRRKQLNPKPLKADELLKDLNSQTEHHVGSEYTTITTTVDFGIPCSPTNSNISSNESCQPRKKRFKRHHSPDTKLEPSILKQSADKNSAVSEPANSHHADNQSSTNVSNSILINGKRYYRKLLNL